MIRQLLRLAVDAVKVEVEHWKNPVQQPVPALPPVEFVPVIDEVKVVSPPVVAPKKIDVRWQSTKFHTETLMSTTCPDCDAPKKVGWYRCPVCTEVAVAGHDALVKMMSDADAARRRRS